MIKYGIAVTLLLAAVGLGDKPIPPAEEQQVEYTYSDVLPETVGSMTIEQKEFLEVLRFVVKESKT